VRTAFAIWFAGMGALAATLIRIRIIAKQFAAN
jgi:hypothetical protein